jgi:hypothetical protein
MLQDQATAAEPWLDDSAQEEEMNQPAKILIVDD